MGDFSMMAYYHQYQEAATRLDRARQRVENLKDSLIEVEDEDRPEVYRQIAAAGEELHKAQAEADDLYYKAHYGKSRAQLRPAEQITYTDKFGKPVRGW